MTIEERQSWMRSFQRHFDTQGMFNNIEGILWLFSRAGLVQPKTDSSTGSWTSRVDAAILHGIQDGMALFQGRISTSINPGAEPWRDFFGKLTRNESRNEIRESWGQAEAAATKWGEWISQDLRHTHSAHEWAGINASVIGLGNAYRESWSLSSVQLQVQVGALNAHAPWAYGVFDAMTYPDTLLPGAIDAPSLGPSAIAGGYSYSFAYWFGGK